MWQSFRAVVCRFALAFILCSASAMAMGLDPAFDQDLLGPDHATGVIVWNHGRSLTVEDSESPTPPFLQMLREGGWEVLRFDRPRDGDTLTDSTRRLIDHVVQLKHKGYRRVVLAGQSFGAFLALMAADASDEVDAVVATAPAAFGSFEEFYESWRLNAIRLYPLLERVKRARVMLFFFHGDDFDPGGRGERSRAILSERGLGFAVVDQPAFLVGHWASSTGLFLRRFGRCIRDFVDADVLQGELICRPAWGETPSAELRLPDELLPPLAASPAAAAAIGASAPASAPVAPGRCTMPGMGSTQMAVRFSSPSKSSTGSGSPRCTPSAPGSKGASPPNGAGAKAGSSRTTWSSRKRARARSVFTRAPMGD